MTTMTMIWGVLIGIGFGLALSLSGASSHKLIVNALLLRDLRLMKIIMTALAVGLIGVNLLDAAGLAHLKIKPAYLLGVTLGGLLFGVGFAVAGFCPGTCLVGAVERKLDALFVVLGGLLGATTFGLLYPRLKPILIDRFNYGEVRLPQLLGVPPLILAGLLAIGLLVFAWWLPDRRNEGNQTSRKS